MNWQLQGHSRQAIGRSVGAIERGAAKFVSS
jgi:hypothetical protein